VETLLFLPLPSRPVFINSALTFRSDVQNAEKRSSKRLRQLKGYSTRETRNRVGEGIGRTIGIKGFALSMR